MEVREVSDGRRDGGAGLEVLEAGDLLAGEEDELAVSVAEDRVALRRVEANAAVFTDGRDVGVASLVGRASFRCPWGVSSTVGITSWNDLNLREAFLAPPSAGRFFRSNAACAAAAAAASASTLRL